MLRNPVAWEGGEENPNKKGTTTMLSTIEFRARMATWLACITLALASVAYAQSTNEPVPAHRLILQYSTASATLGLKPATAPTEKSQVALTKVLPPSDELPEGKGPFCGFW